MKTFFATLFKRNEATCTCLEITGNIRNKIKVNIHPKEETRKKAHKIKDKKAKSFAKTNQECNEIDRFDASVSLSLYESFPA